MKKLISLIFVALLSSQMWAAYTTTITVYPSDAGQVSLSQNSGWATTVSATVSGYSDYTNIYAQATKTGYVFVGWANNTTSPSSYLSTSTANNCKYNFKPSSYSNKTFYAIFALEDKSVSVTQNGNGGTTSWADTSTPSGYVDLGLPSGLLWASSDLDGYYKWNTSTSASAYGSSGYTNTTGSWTNTPTAITTEGVRLPSSTEFQELLNTSNVKVSATSSSLTITHNNNSSKKIVFSKDGYYSTNSTKVTNSYTVWWSSTYDSSGKAKAMYCCKDATKGVMAYNQYYACKVRTVWERPYKTLTIKAGTATYVYNCIPGQKVTVTPTAASGYAFSSWSKTAGTTLTLSGNTFTVTADATYTANFNIVISAEADDSDKGSGLVSKTDGSGYAASVSVASGTKVYLKATPSSGDYVFDYWSNDQDQTTISDASTNVTPSVPTTYTAHFTAAPAGEKYAITVALGENMTEAMGSVSVSEGADDVEYGDEVTVTATPNIGYRFLRWDDSSTDAVHTINVTGNHEYLAYFEELPLKTTTVAQDGTGSGTYNLVKLSDEYVKLGNIYWATKNVGAETETDKGNYYAWGETTTKSDYRASTYTYTSQTVDGNDLLPAAADAATSFAGLGSDWRMPTWSELRDLAFYSQQEPTTKSGVNGYTFTRNGQSIFIPLTGYKFEGNTFSTTSAIYLWGKQLSSVSYGGYYSPYYMVVYQNGNDVFHDVETNARSIGAYEGMPIRPVYVGTVPTLPTCTLTINANGNTYTYIVVNGQQLTVNVTPQEHYRFTGWTKTAGTALTISENTFTVTADATYTANFELSTYTISIGSYENGTVTVTSQGTSQDVASGGSVTLTEGVNVTILAVPNAHGRFMGWTPAQDYEDDIDGASVDIINLRSNRTYTPSFESNVALSLVDTENEAYYTALYSNATYAGKMLTVTMTGRRLTAGSWMTFCAPFEFDIPAGHALDGAVYRFINGTMTGTNTEGYISLDFVRTHKIEANVPYLVVAKTTTDTDLEFDGVTIEDAPEQKQVVASSGDVQFVSQPWKDALVNEALELADFYIASGNTLRYAKVGNPGTTIRAFRAYFHRLRDLDATPAPRRIVISLDGVETTKEIGVDGEIEDTTRKYMENGILYIERNGVRYDAQGQRAE